MTDTGEPLLGGGGDGATLGTMLAPERQNLLPFAVLSLVFHLVGAGSMWGATAFIAVLSAFLPMCSPPPPITDAIEVSIVSLPKSQSNVPDRAARVARASGEVTAQPPPPVVESELKFEQEEKVETKGNVDDSARQKLLDDLQRKAMLEELMNAPDGTVDRDATDPNGSEQAAIAALGAGSKGDPEFNRWVAEVQKLLMQHFKPIGAITEGRPDLKCMVKIDVDPVDGRIRNYEISEPSGILVFDQAAERAVQEIAALPLPPEKYRPLVAQGVAFRFTPP